MPEPVEIQIMQAFEAALRGMTGTRHWGGAYPNDPRVVAEYLEPGTPAVTYSPTLCVLDADGATIKSIVGVGAMLGFEHHMPIAVYGNIRADATVSRRDWLLRLWKDHVISVLGNTALAALIRAVRPDGELATDGGGLDPWGAFRQNWTVIYDQSYTVA